METITLKEFNLEEKTSNGKSIVLFNDDVNSFDHVIECLVTICEHSAHQAEQCAMIVHNNGKCSVKGGNYDDLELMCTSLLENDLNAEIQ